MRSSRSSRRLVVVFMAGIALGGLVFAGGMASANHVFPDTPPWIHDEAAWLRYNGIVAGYPDGTFRPNENITRGQAAFWFANYNSAHYVQTNQDTWLFQDAVFTDVACGNDRRAVAGGGRTTATDVFITDSFPVDDGTWRVRWETENDEDKSFTTTAYAFCMPKALPN